MEKEIKKIPYKEYLKFTDEYFKSNMVFVRFGQVFLNKFYPDISDPDLYYCTDINQAHTIIHNTYIDFG